MKAFGIRNIPRKLKITACDGGDGMPMIRAEFLVYAFPGSPQSAFPNQTTHGFYPERRQMVAGHQIYHPAGAVRMCPRRRPALAVMLVFRKDDRCFMRTQFEPIGFFIDRKIG
jgi:hypothetical protein